MKYQKGITLITLVITIIIMFILTGVVTYSGIEAVNSAKKTAFISELEMIQAKVNVIYEERKTNSEKVEYYNSIGQDISNVDSERLTEILGETNKEGFLYFKPKDLEKLDLDNISGEVLINYDTREVVSLTGIEIDGVMYYKLKDIPNYKGYNVNYTESNLQAPTFTVSQTKLSENEYRFTIKDIVYTSNVNGGTVSYKKHSDTNWILNGTNTSFTVTEPGLYDIKFTDKAGNSTIVQEYIYVTDGLFAHYDAENNTRQGHDATTTTWEDLSGNGHDATTLGSAVWENNKLVCDGIDDYVDTGIKQSDFGQKITIETVANFQEVSNYRGLYGFHFYNFNDNIYEGMLSQYDGGNIYFGMGCDDKTVVNVHIPSTTLLNKLTHITVVMEGKKGIKLYLNGILISEVTATGNINFVDSYNFMIAKSLPDSNRYFKGTISNFIIYNRVLTNDEIRQNYEIDKYRFGITE